MITSASPMIMVSLPSYKNPGVCACVCASLSNAFCCIDFSWTRNKRWNVNFRFPGLVKGLPLWCSAAVDCGAAVVIDEVAANPLRAALLLMMSWCGNCFLMASGIAVLCGLPNADSVRCNRGQSEDFHHWFMITLCDNDCTDFLLAYFGLVRCS